jgi:replication factor C subunit 2/4
MLCYPHLNVSRKGMPGIGKTTSIHCLAHQMLGDAYKDAVLELNASDERYVVCTRLGLTLMLCT